MIGFFVATNQIDDSDSFVIEITNKMVESVFCKLVLTLIRAVWNMFQSEVCFCLLIFTTFMCQLNNQCVSKLNKLIV